MKSFIKYPFVCIAMAAMLAPLSSPAREVSQEFNLPATANLTIDEGACNNSGGPQITLEGTIKLGNVCAEITLSNNAKGTHTMTVLREYKVSLALDKSITIPKQPVRGGEIGRAHV